MVYEPSVLRGNPHHLDLPAMWVDPDPQVLGKVRAIWAQCFIVGILPGSLHVLLGQLRMLFEHPWMNNQFVQLPFFCLLLLLYCCTILRVEQSAHCDEGCFVGAPASQGGGRRFDSHDRFAAYHGSREGQGCPVMLDGKRERPFRQLPLYRFIERAYMLQGSAFPLSASCIQARHAEMDFLVDR